MLSTAKVAESRNSNKHEAVKDEEMINAGTIYLPTD